MTGDPAKLVRIQRWMQSVIMHSGGVAEGVASPQARQQFDIGPDKLENIVTRSRNLSGAERLEIYVDAYFERLLECVREEFRATCHALGNELFDAVAFGYLQHAPSRSYTLGALGAKFPQFLAESRLHAHAAPPEAPAGWADFVAELAGFERALHEVYDGPGGEDRPGLDWRTLGDAGLEDWGRLKVLPAECLRLARFEHPVHEYWNDFKSGHDPSPPEARTCWLAVCRRNFHVEPRELSAAQFTLLGHLIAGLTLEQAIAATVTARQEGEALWERQLGDWFADWTAAGFFRHLELVEAPLE